MSFKEQLKTELLPKAVGYYNAGLDINSAVVKTAEDFHLNIDQTDRLMEMMNTARVIAHYEKNAEDRTSNCDIADRDTVHRMLFRDKEPSEKTASCGSDEGFHDYSGYLDRERDYRHARSMEKAASAEPRFDFDAPAQTGSGYPIEKVAEKVAAYLQDVESVRQFAEERKGMAEAHLSTQLSKLASMLSAGYEPERRFALFKAAASARYPGAAAGVEADMPADVVAAAAPHLRKLARANVIDDSEIATERMLAAEIEDGMAKTAKIDEVVNSCRKQEAHVKELLRKYAEIQKVGQGGGIGPQRSRPDAGRKGKGRKDGDGDGKEKDSGSARSGDPWFRRTHSAMQTLVGDRPDVKNLYDYLRGSFMDAKTIDEALFEQPKEKSTELRDYVDNLQRSAILSELANDDPILSEADPKTLAQSYSMLVQTAPETSLNKEVVRAVLRQAVNSVAVSPFDAKQWADLDRVLLQNKEMA